MLTAVAVTFAVAALAPALHRVAGRFTGWLLTLAPVGVIVYLLKLAPEVLGGGSVSTVAPWVPSLGLNLEFRLDGLSLLFGLLIAGIGAVVVFYSGEYLAGHPHLPRYYAALLTFMGSMLGLVLAGNLLLLFVFWELTSVSSYLLIGFDHSREAARRGALQALLVTGSGGLAMLAGIVLTGQIAGTYEIAGLLALGDVVRVHPLYPAVLVLILLGAFTKSAQFPFHFWLPNAMEAPTPASAYLHAATMVKAGIYLLARLTPVLGGTELWWWAVTLTGGVTMLLGAWLALFKSDLKQILAYSTISVLGLLTLLLGVGGDAAWTAMAVYLAAHGLYKGALFLVAGAVDHETGTRDINRLRGLRTAMPITAAIALTAALSMAGLPPLFGFIGKEMVLAGVLAGAGAAIPLAVAIVLSGALMLAVGGLVALRPFFGKSVPSVGGEAAGPPRQAHEAPPGLWVGPALLAAGGVWLGLFPAMLNSLFQTAAGAMAGASVRPVQLALFHGLNVPLLLSAVTVAVGVAIYAGHRRLRDWAVSFGQVRWGPGRWYDAVFNGVMSVAVRQTRVLQNGYLRYYLLTIIVTTVGLAGYALARHTALPGQWSAGDVRLHEVVLAVVIIIAILVAIRSRSGLTAVAALGVVGIGMALIFVLFGAPDLAMTQVVVDMLTVILLVLVLYHLPEMSQLTAPAGRFRDLTVAIAAGSLMAVLVLMTAALERPATAARYFVENSVPLAHGRNVVNVILVDFRVLDTLGEVTVMAVAAIGVYSLRRLREPPTTPQPNRRTSRGRGRTR